MDRSTFEEVPGKQAASAVCQFKDSRPPKNSTQKRVPPREIGKVSETLASTHADSTWIMSKARRKFLG